MKAYDSTLKNIIESKHKYIYVGGKGGVGKTTTSSSLGVTLSKYRKSVLIISTDPAHNLGDSFDQKFTSKPTKVNGIDNLYCMEIDPTNYLSNIPLEQLVGVENNEYTKSVLQEITSSFPGIDEATSLGEVMKLIRSFDYETIIFDTAPTGHTLRLLNLPNIIEKGLSKMLYYQQKYGNIINQVTSMISTDVTKVQQKMVDYLLALKEAVEEMNKKFKDAAVTTFIAVCIPEFLSLYETERLVVELSKFEIDICNIVINQVLFPDKGIK